MNVYVKEVASDMLFDVLGTYFMIQWGNHVPMKGKFFVPHFPFLIPIRFALITQDDLFQVCVHSVVFFFFFLVISLPEVWSLLPGIRKPEGKREEK